MAQPKSVQFPAETEVRIPCSRVTFQTTVNAFNGEPEYTFYDGGTHRKSRNAKIYWTDTCVILEQEGNEEFIPHANVKQATKKKPAQPAS